MADFRFLRFLLVGILNTIVGYAIYIVGLLAGLHYGAALAAATVLGMLFNFKSTGVLVFSSHDNRLLLKFSAVYGMVYVFNVIGVAVFFRFGFAQWLSGLFMLFPAALLSYYLNGLLVFSNDENK